MRSPAIPSHRLGLAVPLCSAVSHRLLAFDHGAEGHVVRKLEMLEEAPGIEAIGGQQQQLLQRSTAAEAAAGNVEVGHRDGLAFVVSEAHPVTDVETGAVFVSAVEILDRLSLGDAELADVPIRSED